MSCVCVCVFCCFLWLCTWVSIQNNVYFLLLCSWKKCAGRWSCLGDGASNSKPRWTSCRRSARGRDGASTERGWGTRMRLLILHSSAGLLHFISVLVRPGHRRDSVHPAAAEPPDGARVRPARTPPPGEPAGCGLGPAAKCGPQAGDEPQHTGMCNTHTHRTMFPESLFGCILVGTQARRMFALHIPVETKGSTTLWSALFFTCKF